MKQVCESDSIAAHGVDSLMAVEIRISGGKEMRVELTMLEVWNWKKSVGKVVVDKKRKGFKGSFRVRRASYKMGTSYRSPNKIVKCS